MWQWRSLVESGCGSHDELELVGCRRVPACLCLCAGSRACSRGQRAILQCGSALYPALCFACPASGAAVAPCVHARRLSHEPVWVRAGFCVGLKDLSTFELVRLSLPLELSGTGALKAAAWLACLTPIKSAVRSAGNIVSDALHMVCFVLLLAAAVELARSCLNPQSLGISSLAQDTSVGNLLASDKSTKRGHEKTAKRKKKAKGEKRKKKKAKQASPSPAPPSGGPAVPVSQQAWRMEDPWDDWTA